MTGNREAKVASKTLIVYSGTILVSLQKQTVRISSCFSSGRLEGEVSLSRRPSSLPGTHAACP